MTSWPDQLPTGNQKRFWRDPVKRIGAPFLGCQTWSRERLGLSFITLRREEIDWAGIRAAAVAIGIRRAARQAARDLLPDEQERFMQRAMKRCSRERWLVKSQQDKADAVVNVSNRAVRRCPQRFRCPQ